MPQPQATLCSGTSSAPTPAAPIWATSIGLSIGSAGNTIGGTTADAGNVISFNSTAGIQITGAGALGQRSGSATLIGTDSSGQVALGNDIGVLITGGTANFDRRNDGRGGQRHFGQLHGGNRALGQLSRRGPQILGNRIGTDPSGTHAVTRADMANPARSALQNAGVVIIGSTGNTWVERARRRAMSFPGTTSA